MGRPKAFMEFAGGRRVVDCMMEALRAICQEVIVVTNAPERFAEFGARTVVDPVDYAGPLAALAEGLRAARTEWSLAVSCDLPLLRPRFIETLYSMREGDEAVVPRTREHGPHPLCALYRKGCLDAIRQALREGEKRMVSFYPRVMVRWVDEEELRRGEPDMRSLVNVNTPEELEWARRMAGGQ